MKRISRAKSRISLAVGSRGGSDKRDRVKAGRCEGLRRALRPSEENYRRIIETTHEGIWVADLEGITRFANPQMARMLGTTPEEMLGRSVFDYVFEKDHAAVRQHFKGFLCARTGQEVEERLRRNEGTEFWATVAASVFRNKHGRAVGFLGMFSDVTERKRMEEALRKSEASLQLQISRMPIPHILWSPEFRVRAWNPAAERLFGYTAGEALGRHPYELIVPRAAQPQVDGIWRRLLRGDATAHSINENIAKDGRKMVCEWSNTPIKAADGEVVGVLSMVLDITERKRAEEVLRQAYESLEAKVKERTAEVRASHEALAESEEKYRRLFETISDGVMVVDAATRQIVDMNEASLRLYGYTREECRKLNHRQITAEPEDSEASIRLTLAGAAPRIPVRYHRKKDGTVFPVEISASTFTLKGRPVLCASVRDISERKRAEEALCRTLELERQILAISEQERRRLGQDLHDDLCQQLVGIQFLCQGLAGDLAKRKGRAAQAVEIGRMVQRALNQTRELARGLSPVRLEPGGLVEAMRELVAWTRKVFRIDCRLAVDGAIRISDHTSALHLYRIAQEAVGNAVKHGQARCIRIGLRAGGGGTRLAVRDDGVGISRKPADRQGMGLAIMRYRAEVMGGSLLIQREAGGGTAVICTLPKRTAPVKARNQP